AAAELTQTQQRGKSHVKRQVVWSDAKPKATARRSSAPSPRSQASSCTCGLRHRKKMSCQSNVRRLKKRLAREVSMQALNRLRLAKKDEEILAARHARRSREQAVIPNDIREFLARNPQVSSLNQLFALHQTR
ncbi:unnamed protein product, partial [Polarella glacialis]